MSIYGYMHGFPMSHKIYTISLKWIYSDDDSTVIYLTTEVRIYSIVSKV